MINYKKLLIVLAFAITNHSLAYAIDEQELKRAMDKVKAANGTEEEKIQVEKYLRTTLEMQEQLSFEKVKQPCNTDLKRICGRDLSVSDNVKCLKANREKLDTACEEAVKNEFGGKPLQQAEMHNGVRVPAGSIFNYLNGKIFAATVPEDVSYNGITFKSGQIHFFKDKPGIWAAVLAKDQVIDGIEFQAENAIGPFFNDKGEVVNATLAKDTTIKNVTYKKGTQIEFYSKQQVKFGWLAKDVTINEKVYEAEGLIWYAPDGSVSRYAEKTSAGKKP